jgi:hypothetical protein
LLLPTIGCRSACSAEGTATDHQTTDANVAVTDNTDERQKKDSSGPAANRTTAKQQTQTMVKKTGVHSPGKGCAAAKHFRVVFRFWPPQSRIFRLGAPHRKTTKDFPRWVMFVKAVQGAPKKSSAQNKKTLFPTLKGNWTTPRVVNAAVAKKHGIETKKQTVWVFGKDDAPPCKMETGRFFLTRIGVDEYLNMFRFVVELTGDCPLKPIGFWHTPPFVLAQVTDTRPAHCRFRRTQKGYRKHGRGAAPKFANLGLTPSAINILQGKKCTLPRCENRWQINHIPPIKGVHIQEFMASYVNARAIRANASPATSTRFKWWVKEHGGMVINGPQLLAAKDWSPDYAGLSGVFYDSTNVRYVLLSQWNFVRIYSFSSLILKKSPPPVKEIDWITVHDEERHPYSLCLKCYPNP